MRQMNWLDSNIKTIKELIAKGDNQSVAYAALETRLALEQLIYQRLRLAHSYISANDLRTWTPGYVIKTLIEEVDEDIGSEYTLSISTDPAPKHDMTAEDFASLEYVPVGTQTSINVKLLKKLWNSMGSFLHSRFPTSEEDPIGRYSDKSVVIPKIQDALQELERMATGTMVGVLTSKMTSFKCVCGYLNKRSTRALRDRKTIRCIQERCKEQYIVEVRDEDFFFERHVLHVPCQGCPQIFHVPYRELVESPPGSSFKFECQDCSETTSAGWRLMHTKRKS